MDPAPTPTVSDFAVRPDVEAFLAHSRVFHEARWYTNSGPLTRALEWRLAHRHGAARCVTLASGFWALVLAIKALALPGRSEAVLVSPPRRYLADAVAWAGLDPVFSTPGHGAAGPVSDSPTALIGADAAVVVGSHCTARPVDAGRLDDWDAECGVPLVISHMELCGPTHLGRFGGRPSHAEVFSLHSSGPINGFEGGYVTTDDARLAEKIFLMRGFGFNGQDNVEEFGINAKLNEIHAAMALTSLDELEGRIGPVQNAVTDTRPVPARSCPVAP